MRGRERMEEGGDGRARRTWRWVRCTFRTRCKMAACEARSALAEVSVSAVLMVNDTRWYTL